MVERPCIAVSGPDRGGLAMWWFTRLAVWLAGGRAVRVTPREVAKARQGAAFIHRYHGLIVSGGADINPDLYGVDPGSLTEELTNTDVSRWRRLLSLIINPLVYLFRRVLSLGTVISADTERDAMERGLIESALHKRMPILGICRGMQFVNVCCGGTLYPSLHNFYTEVPQVRSVFPRKHIDIVPGTMLFGITRANYAVVNALHDQGVDKLGEGLVVSAREKSRVVQAIEHVEMPFVLGVQWHPEFLPQANKQRAIFKKLVDAARKHADNTDNSACG